MDRLNVSAITDVEKGNKFQYPNNSLRGAMSYRTLLNNLDRVPIEEIERLITKYNLI